MKFTYLTIFPEIFQTLDYSLIGKAQDKSLIEIETINLRDFATDIHKSVDDAPYGGGAGMVMTAPIWGDAIDYALSKINKNSSKVELIILTPAGEKFDQNIAQEMSKSSDLIFACGRYEGLDQRVYEYYSNPEFAQKCNFDFIVRELSIGDYVLNGGEVAALAITEVIARLIPGVIGNQQSLVEESHSDGQIGVLEYPIYTRPQNWRGLEVPEILLSGNHQAIAEFRKKQSILRSNPKISDN